MTWHFLTAKLTVKDGERALLTRNGDSSACSGPVVTGCSISGAN